jgi:CubicO group peptidase (beta-lactamase class C family)
LYSVGTFYHGGARGTVGFVDPKKDVVCLFMMQRTPAQMEEPSLFVSMAAAAILD